jgi:hypothetical protein
MGRPRRDLRAASRISLGRSCPDVCIELLTLPQRFAAAADEGRIGGAEDLVPGNEIARVRADLLDNTGYFRAEDQRISLGQSAVAGYDQGVPRGLRSPLISGLPEISHTIVHL